MKAICYPIYLTYYPNGASINWNSWILGIKKAISLRYAQFSTICSYATKRHETSSKSQVIIQVSTRQYYYVCIGHDTIYNTYNIFIILASSLFFFVFNIFLGKIHYLFKLLESKFVLLLGKSKEMKGKWHVSVLNRRSYQY